MSERFRFSSDVYAKRERIQIPLGGLDLKISVVVTKPASPAKGPDSGSAPVISLDRLRAILVLDDFPAMTVAVSKIPAEGVGVFNGLSPGRYRVIMGGIPDELYLKSASFARQTEVLSKGLDLTAPLDSPLELMFGSPAGQIQGTVRDAEGKAVPRAVLLLAPKTPAQRRDLFRVVVADENGQFTFSSLIDGEYSLLAWDDVDVKSIMNPELASYFRARASDANLKQQRTAAIDLQAISLADTAKFFREHPGR